MEKPLLSICIPTYNRAECLKKSLDSLQKLDGFDKVEVVVCDNCSTDDTQLVCKEFCKQHSNAFYFKNEQNIKDKNFPTVLMKGRGVYRKLVNDNTIYNSGYLTDLLEFIERYKDQKPYERPLIVFLNGGGVGMKADTVVEGKSLSDFVRLAGYRATWIGGFGLWQDDCNGLQHEFSYCDKNLWQTYKSLALIADGRPYLLVNRPICSVVAPEKKDLSYGIYTVFCKNYFELLQPYVEQNKLTSEDLNFAKKDLLYNYFAKNVFQLMAGAADIEFGAEKDFRKKILNEYRGEKYYASFCVWYFWNFKLAKPIGRLWRGVCVRAKNKILPTAFGKKALSFKRKMKVRLY